MYVYLLIVTVSTVLYSFVEIYIYIYHFPSP